VPDDNEKLLMLVSVEEEDAIEKNEEADRFEDVKDGDGEISPSRCSRHPLKYSSLACEIKLLDTFGTNWNASN